MSKVAENAKIFAYYVILPSELRLMVVDEMDSADRCRFTRCSRLSRKEAKLSKNYIYSLELQASYDFYAEIRIGHNKSDTFPDFNYKLVFENFGKKCLKCVDSNKKLLWVEELDDSIDWYQYFAEYFKKLLKEYQTKIKSLNFYGSLFNTLLKNYDFGIENLKNLEDLGIYGEMDVPLYLSKTRRPLKKLSIDESVNLFHPNRENMSSVDYEQIYQVQNCLIMRDTKFTYEQMLRLSALEAYIRIGNLTEQQIFNFIRLWQNGTIGDRTIFWLGDPIFEIEQLFQLLEERVHGNPIRRKYSLEIKNNKEYEKRARLLYFQSEKRLIFRPDKETIHSWSTQNIEELDKNYSYFLRTVSNEH